MPFDSNLIEATYPEASGLMFEPMLIWKLPAGKEDQLSRKCESGEYFLEEKKDGCLYQFVKTEHYNYLFSRTISKVTGLLAEKGANVPHIMDALASLPPKTILIGEIYYPGGTSKSVTPIMGCLPDKAIERQAENPIHFYIHDIIYFDNVKLLQEGAETRYKILEAIWNKYNLSQYPFLELAQKVDTDLEATISDILKNGGEGAVLKKRTAPYSPGARPAHDTLKIKQMDNTDLVCTRVIPATREYTGKDIETWPYWEVAYPTTHGKWDGWDWREVVIGNYYEKYIKHTIDELPIGPMDRRYQPVTKPYALGWMTSIGIGAYSDNGELVELGTVSSGLTDEDRANMAKDPDRYTGMVVSLHCMAIDRKEKTLRHPVFKSWREDKNPQDCTIKSVFS